MNKKNFSDFDDEQQCWYEQKRSLQKEVWNYEKTLDIMTKMMPYSKTTTMKSEIVKIVEDGKNWFLERDIEANKLYQSLSKIRTEVKAMKSTISDFSSGNRNVRDIEN
jgi:hypothetical protein